MSVFEIKIRLKVLEADKVETVDVLANKLAAIEVSKLWVEGCTVRNEVVRGHALFNASIRFNIEADKDAIRAWFVSNGPTIKPKAITGYLGHHKCTDDEKKPCPKDTVDWSK